jgi:hypothetical protein
VNKRLFRKVLDMLAAALTGPVLPTLPFGRTKSASSILPLPNYYGGA